MGEKIIISNKDPSQHVWPLLTNSHHAITVGLAFTFEATSSPFEVRLAVLGAEDSSLVVADY